MDYYAILGVNQNANAADIRRAYHRLAVLYHPDKNPDPEAAEYFKVINAAYDVLGDVENRAEYDRSQSLAWTEALSNNPSSPRHRDPRYRPQPPGTRRKGQREKVREMMEHYMPYAKRIVQVSLLLCLIILTDYLLPASESQEPVAEKSYHRARSRNGETYIDGVNLVTKGGSHFLVTIPQGEFFAMGDIVSHRSTRLFSIPLDLTPTSGKAIRAMSTIYGYYFFFPTILLVLSILFFGDHKNVEFQFNLAIACALVLPLTILFLFVHNW